MVNFVTKKDGSRVPFDQEKMNASIMAACNDAEIPEDKTDAVIKEISGLVLMIIIGFGIYNFILRLGPNFSLVSSRNDFGVYTFYRIYFFLNFVFFGSVKF